MPHYDWPPLQSRLVWSRSCFGSDRYWIGHQPAFRVELKNYDTVNGIISNARLGAAHCRDVHQNYFWGMGRVKDLSLGSPASTCGKLMRSWLAPGWMPGQNDSLRTKHKAGIGFACHEKDPER